MRPDVFQLHVPFVVYGVFHFPHQPPTLCEQHPVLDDHILQVLPQLIPEIIQRPRLSLHWLADRFLHNIREALVRDRIACREHDRVSNPVIEHDPRGHPSNVLG